MKVLCALRFFATGSFQQCVGNEEAIALSQPSISRIITAVAKAITVVGKEKGWVRFPSTAQQKAAVKEGFLSRGKIPGVLGCVDGSLIAIVRPKKLGPGETESYWSRKGYYALNCMVVCDAKLNILAIDPRFPGSCHDYFVWRHSAFRRRLTRGLLLHGEVLLGESGYPLEPWIMTPVPGHPNRLTAEGRYNEAHASMRNAVERCIGVVKSRFRCLQRYRVLHYSPQKAATIVAACAALHNICLAAGVPLPDDPGDDGAHDDSAQEPAQAQVPLQVQVPPQAHPVQPSRALFQRGRAVRETIVGVFRLPRNLRIAYLQSVCRRIRWQMRWRHVLV
ncbi:putative nuclease HARBI1 [Dermacentor andersoni]|uniref:putative nuclease HARBI1 n=1 Tax=Dermacentor andersoni TaxID=34620 RepID=UPI0024170309|nr:putative nuclease HARBI1 [Dermacentor andersoni]